jgi:hypothetical protein
MLWLTIYVTVNTRSSTNHLKAIAFKWLRLKRTFEKVDKCSMTMLHSIEKSLLQTLQTFDDKSIILN